MAKYKIIPSSRTIVHSPISIGHKAEKGVEAIEFDLTAWVETYGSGTLTVIMRRWGDAIPYPIALEIDENNKATWTLSDIDTAKAGMAYAQLNYIVGDEVVKKSDIYTFRVMDSLTEEGEPPEAYESWLEQLTHLAAEAMAEVLDIEGIVTDKTLTVDGGIADAKATGDALALKADKSTTYTKTEVDQMIEDVEVETDTTLSVSGAPADAKKTGDELSALKADLGNLPFIDVTTTSDMTDTTKIYRYNGALYFYDGSAWTEVGTGGGGSNSEYKTVTLHTITLEPSIILDNTRILSNKRSTVNGYKTYLIDMSQITQPLVLTLSHDNGKWGYWGYYVYDSATDAYTWSNINSELTMIYNRSGYSGIFVSSNSNNVVFDFYTGIDVVTNDGYKCGRKGFRSVECEYMPFAPDGDGYFKVIFPINKTNAYIVDVGSAAFTAIKQSVANQNITATTNNISSTPTKKILFANMKNRQAYIEVRASQQGSWRTLCQRGIYLYELTKPEEIVQCRNKNHISVLAHGLNNFDDLILSMANGWSGGELDVRKTSDGIYVFSHEPALNGMTIASTTYDTLSAGYARVYTLDELLGFTLSFDIWYDLDFKTGSELDAPYLFRRLLKHTNKVAYWGGSIPNTAPPYKNGWPVYDFGGYPPTDDDDISVYQWYVGGSDLDRAKPYKYFMANDPGTITLADIKAGTYDGYAFIEPYFSRNSEQVYLSDD